MEQTKANRKKAESFHGRNLESPQWAAPQTAGSDRPTPTGTYTSKNVSQSRLNMASGETSRASSRKAIYPAAKGVGFSPTPGMPYVRAIAKALLISFQDVSHFIHRRYHKIGRARRKLIRQYFIEQGWLPKPKPRKPPACRNCGLNYPTRKFREQSTDSQTAAQSETIQRNSTGE
jgi:hypothetical protein